MHVANGPGRIDDHDAPPNEAERTQDSVRRSDLFVHVGEQWKGEAVVIGELLVALDVLGRDREDDCVEV